jgi:hypothetical protein
VEEREKRRSKKKKRKKKKGKHTEGWMVRKRRAKPTAKERGEEEKE